MMRSSYKTVTKIVEEAEETFINSPNTSKRDLDRYETKIKVSPSNSTVSKDIEDIM